VDNAGRIFACTVLSDLITVFRLSATLKVPVHVGRLQAALEAVLPRFPYFAVQMRRTMFWPCYEPNPQTPQVQADSQSPCQAFVVRGRGRFPFRVRAYHARIAVEFSHAVTDANGALEFLKSLVAEYLRQGGIVPEETQGLMLPGQTPDPEECEDAFRKYCQKGLPHPEKRAKAFRLKMPVEPRGVFHITTGIVCVETIRACARQHNVSLTELLVALYLDTFQVHLHQLPPRQQRRRARPICLDVPVNLRSLFPSRTLRNFFLPVYLTIDPRLGHYTFDEILKKVHHSMRTSLDMKELARQITRNVGAERHPFIRTLPFWVKGQVLSVVYHRLSLRRTTSSLSNLGRVDMPPELSEAIERFEFVPVFPNARKVSCGCISFANRLYITFGRTLTQPTVEQTFFRKLVALGCPVKIETN
jgi:NRPS condensation-like uncharacterized protein